MTLTLNSVGGFLSTAKLQHVSKSFTGDNRCSAWGKVSDNNKNFSAPLGFWFGPRRPNKDIRRGRAFSAADSSRASTDSTSLESDSTKNIRIDDQLSPAKPVPLNSAAGNIQSENSNRDEIPSYIKEAADGLPNASEAKRDKTPFMPKRSSLTAREKLRAARVLSRYTDSKPSKSEMGSKVLDALRESDKGKKRSGLPEAPTNLFDDSKRGMPKQGLTFDFPGGVDLFIIIFSTVFISTVMFGTTYIVWKAGAIHFNEY
ncbi:uncharacterized protein LOC143878623 [Tasmannia lanceolata]|uniref:uncharacterized protein LOC143878623 n=1 Tax=Tasmannia lanceolata TaxID=3420 RepID=UPI0040647403